MCSQVHCCNEMYKVFPSLYVYYTAVIRCITSVPYTSHYSSNDLFQKNPGAAGSFSHTTPLATRILCNRTAHTRAYMGTDLHTHTLLQQQSSFAKKQSFAKKPCCCRTCFHPRTTHEHTCIYVYLLTVAVLFCKKTKVAVGFFFVSTYEHICAHLHLITSAIIFCRRNLLEKKERKKRKKWTLFFFLFPPTNTSAHIYISLQQQWSFSQETCCCRIFFRHDSSCCKDSLQQNRTYTCTTTNIFAHTYLITAVDSL